MLRSMLFGCVLLASFSARAEFFPVSIETRAQYNCPSESYVSCQLETTNTGNIQIEIVNGYGTWNQTSNFDGVDFDFQVDILKTNFPDGYRVYVTARTGFGGAMSDSRAYVDVADPGLFPLTGTFTSFVPTGPTYANGTIEVKLAH